MPTSLPIARKLPLPGRICRSFLGVWAIVVFLGAGALGASEVNAHTELERADPPVNGVVAAAPERLTLVFTGEVAAADPAPSVQVFNAAGEPQPAEVLPVAADGNARTVSVDVADLDTGTYTVAWTVRSVTDGHILSGSYAFSVGGSVPPGTATSAEATPAPWAVATRWLTFLGIAVVLGGLLFEPAVLRGTEPPAPFRRRRTWLVLVGAAVALVATLAEPLLQTLYPPENAKLDLASAVAGLPDAWWLRPVGLALLCLIAVVVAVPLRGRVPPGVAWSGSAIGLLALAGLPLTSHAAAEETWRVAAMLANLIHQVAVALWTGGLVLLALWWPDRHAGANADLAPIRRFSRLALPLVGLALVTGLINTGFMVPLAAGIEEYGVRREAFAPLWTSTYGVVLLVKLLILLIPIGLAVSHRATIARGIGAITTRVGRLRRTTRLESVAVAVVVLAGVALALSVPPVLDRPPLDTVVLTAPAYTADGAMVDVVHLTLDPAEPGESRLELQVTDPHGEPIPTEPPPRVTVALASLERNGVEQSVSVPLTEPATATYAVDDVSFGPNGWWGLTTTVNRDGQDETQARMNVLLPDPNMHGFDAPPERETTAEAQALYERALEQMTSWTSVRTRERIASGSNAVAIIERAVTTGEEGGPPAQTLVAVYSAGFAPTITGAPPAPPKFVYAYNVTIGDQGWERGADGSWLEAPPTRASLPSEWDNTYAGAEDFQLGATAEINGEPVQVVTFYLPEQGAQAEAWFAWWVGVDSANVYRVAMVAQSHYMLIAYTDINAPIQIEPPASVAERE